MIEKKIQVAEEIHVVLVGYLPQGQHESVIQEYLDELSFLAATAGAIEVKRFYQKLQHPDSKTFLGKGKLEEIRDYV
ncbi:MAG TPA: GTPase HflX, partial [Chitinophagaceae bacterium]|nr:GTPase HflX [Chitinophagaceae bacterium]